MKDNSNKKTQALVIGNKFPIDTRNMEFSTPVFQLLGNESAALIWKIKSPTSLELIDFNYKDVKFGVLTYGKVMFFCVDHQPFADGDSSYHAQFYNFPPDMHMLRSKTDVGLPLYMCVVDQHNTLRALRCINLNKKVTDFIADTFEKQRSEGRRITPAEYTATVSAAYKRYATTKEMMAAAAATSEIKKTIDPV